MAIDPKKIEEWKALVASTSPFAAPDFTTIAELRERIAKAAPELWRATCALIAEVERLQQRDSEFVAVTYGPDRDAFDAEVKKLGVQYLGLPHMAIAADVARQLVGARAALGPGRQIAGQPLPEAVAQLVADDDRLRELLRDIAREMALIPDGPETSATDRATRRESLVSRIAEETL